MSFAAGKILFAALSVLYPFLVFAGLCFWGLSPRKLSLLLIFLAAVRIFSGSRNGKHFFRRTLLTGILVLGCGIFAFVLDNATLLRFYPVFVNLGLLGLFLSTLFSPPNMAFRFAAASSVRLLRTADRAPVERYCFFVTLAWCLFFVLNGTVSLCTVLFADEKVWALYNGLLSYVLIGVFFIVEFLIRRKRQCSLAAWIPFSRLEENSRPDDSVICFDGFGISENVKTWRDFKTDVSRLRTAVEKETFSEWILNADDIYYFLVAVFALFQSKRKILFSANRAPEYIREIRGPQTGFLNDGDAEGSLQIQKLVESSAAGKPWESLDLSTVRTALFTSGTTGLPKEIAKTGAQLESEALALSRRFAENFSGRNVYMTVNHHHIYGMAFGIFLAFSAGLPICRRRLEFPEEVERLVKEPAAIIASPAFFKRFVQTVKKPLRFKTRPFWLSAGGPLPSSVALDVQKISGAPVQEIYGCTEAGAVATRKNGEGLWTPLGDNRVSLAENGCLKINSSYADEKGFVTGDVGKIERDGRFLLEGRADSIVKIEEKRISLPEVEKRLLASGLVRDARVVPMKGKREFLAAAIVLNDAGKAKFSDVPKKEINAHFREHLSGFLENTVLPKKWRYLEELPQDAMGKIKMREIQKLFEIPESPHFRILAYRAEENGFSAKIVIPETSDYFDGHFPGFKLLPAVVQIDLLLRLFRAFCGKPSKLERMHRIKFSSPVRPNVPVNVEGTYFPETGKLHFRFGADSGEVFSSGSVLLKREQNEL